MKCRKFFRTVCVKTTTVLLALGTFAMTAHATPWYENPELVAFIDYPNANESGIYSAGLSENGVYYGTPTAYEKESAYLFKTADILTAGLEPAITNAPLRIHWDTIPGVTCRGMDISEALGMAVIGTSKGENLMSVKVDTTTETLSVGENLFQLWDDKGITIGSIAFSPDSAYLYTDCYNGGAGQNAIYKWEIRNGLASSGTNLLYVTHWDTGHRVRQVTSAKIGDKDLVYFYANEGFVGVIDTTNGEIKTLRAEGTGGSRGSVAVSGLAAGTPHLTIATCDPTLPICVYDLTPDGLALASPEPIAQIDPEVSSTWTPGGAAWNKATNFPVSVNVLDDESAAFLGAFSEVYHACTYVRQAGAPAGVSVTQSVGAHGASSDAADATVESGASFTRTYTADEGYVIAALYVDDVAVPEAQFKTSYELTIAPEADTVVKVLFAKDNAWWVDAHDLGAPAVASVIDFSKGSSGAPFSSGLSENGKYYVTPTYMGGEAAYVFKTADLIAGDTTEHLIITNETFAGAKNRGGDVSEKFGMAIFGTSVVGPAIAVDVTATTETLEEGVNYFRIENDKGISFGCMQFSDDGTSLYTDCYKGGEGNKCIYKWKVENGLRTNGVALTYVTHWNVEDRIRQMSYANVGGKELIYYISNGGLFGVLDTTTGAHEVLRPANGSGNYGAIAVSGVSLESLHLTIVPCSNVFPIAVYALKADGLALEHPEPIVSFGQSDTAGWNPGGGIWHRDGNVWCTGANVADDETVAYIGAFPTSIGPCTYVVKAPMPPSTVTQAIGAHGATSDPADETLEQFAHYTRTYTADEGYVIAAVYANGKAVADAQFKSAYELDIVPDGDTVVSVLFAKKGTWWVDAEGLGGPIAKSCIEYSGDSGGGPFSSGLSENGAYYATPTYMTDESAYLFKTADLLAGDTTENLVIPADKVDGAKNRGGDVSEKFGMAIFGTSVAGPAIAVDVTATTETLEEGVNYFRIENDKGISFGCMQFSDDGINLYTDCYVGGEGQSCIYKWKVENGLRTSGVALTYVAHWDVGNRIRQMSYANVGGKELIYYISNGGLIGVLDTTDGTSRVLRPANGSGNYGAIAVSGVSLGTPHLTVVPCVNTFPIVVYGLAADGLSFVSLEPIVALDRTVTDAWNPIDHLWQRDGTAWATGANVSDDDTVAYIGAFPENLGGCTYVVTARSPVANVVETIHMPGAAEPTVKTTEVGLNSTFSVRYDAPDWSQIESLKIDGVAIAEAAGLTTYELTIQSVAADTAIEVTYVISADGTDGYTNEQAAWFAANGITKENVKSDTDNDGLTAEEECLLGLSATEQDTFKFQVSSIDAKEQVAVTVKLVRTTGGETVMPPVRGTLVLEGTSSIDQPFQEVGTLSIDGAFNGQETETFNFDPANAKFFRAVIK